MFKKNNSANPEQKPKNIVINNIMLIINNLLVGGIVGVSEVLLNNPLFNIIERIQRKKAFSFNPRILYQGSAFKLAVMVPATAVQVSITAFLEKNVKDKSIGIVPACVGGAVSALINTPAEMATLHANRLNTNNTKLECILKKQNLCWIYTGVANTAIRDGVFTAGFLVAPEIIEKQLQKRLGKQAKCAETLSGPIAGVIAAGLSHPFEAIKNMQQKHALEEKISFAEAANKIAHAEGLFGLYKKNQFSLRAMRIVSAVSIMSYVEKRLQLRLGGE